MFWNKTVECMSREEMRELQSERLRKMAAYVYKNSPFYTKRFKQLGITPDDIRDINDIVKLPFTNKIDLRDHYPFGLRASSMSDVVRIHASSGTTGKPVVALSTQSDLERWQESFSRGLVAYGATKDDVAQVSYGYGLFTGGLGAHDACQKIGAAVIPMSSGNTEKQITLMHDFGATILCCTPSYAMYLGEAIKDSPYPRKEFKLRIGVFGAEPWTENMRKKLEETLGIKAYDVYGLSEVAGPGVGFECECQHGLHINEDYYYPEIVNPTTGQPLPEGEVGELCFTHLTKEAMPLMRYRTHDLTALHYEKCSCGRTLVRMDRIMGRCDDMLIIRGVNVFPTQIESVILSLPEFAAHYILVVDRVNNTDTCELKVEVKPEFYSTDVVVLEGMRKKLLAKLRSVIGLGFQLSLVEPKGVERSTGKAKRVVDKRKF
ncbi:MAG: phenylacetate--CoA ligase [Paludibacteraceae bacterium]|jgi:phenylacetate-CoA ligase|nr:phenylacetate--CoA ligase [Paludibacteraceae bacterium]